MDAILFICLGTRDVQIKNPSELDEEIKKGLEDCKYPLDNKNFRDFKVRKFGNWLDNNFELIREKIGIPLIEPCLNYIIEKKKQNIKEIILIATDQKRTIKEEAKEHLGRDTCTIAEFLRSKYLNYYFNNRGKTVPTVETIILNNSPNDYDLMIKELENLITGKEVEGGKGYVVYAEITGGTPQINTSVILNCTRYYRDKVSFLYKSENTKDIKSLNVGRYILDSYEHENLKRLADRYDFDAIAQSESYSDSVKRLAKCACHRMNFDFLNYKIEINKPFVDILSNEMFEELRVDALNLIQKNPKFLFNELYWNAVVMWQRDECANFLGRVWRIMEVSLQYSLLDVIDCKWDEIDNFKDKFSKWIKDNNDFIQYLKNNKGSYGLSEIKELIMPNMPILHACVGFIAEKKPTNDNNNYSKIKSCVGKLRVLGDMRNKSIIAHGFEGISKGIIEEKIIAEEQKDVFPIIRSLIESLGISLSEENPYNIFKDLIIEMNEKKLSESLNV